MLKASFAAALRKGPKEAIAGAAAYNPITVAIAVVHPIIVFFLPFSASFICSLAEPIIEFSACIFFFARSLNLFNAVSLTSFEYLGSWLISPSQPRYKSRLFFIYSGTFGN